MDRVGDAVTAGLLKKTGSKIILDNAFNECGRIGAELSQQAEVSGFLDLYGIEPVFRQLQKPRAGIGHKNRRMGCHDDLGKTQAIHLTKQLQELDLTRRRQSGFRFVEHEQALPDATLFEEAQEALTMRMREEVWRR